MPIAQTFTASLDAGLPKTGIESVDRVVAAIGLTLIFLSAAVTVAKQVRARIQDLMGAARSIIAGVEVSRRDFEEVLENELPGIPRDRLLKIAKRLHDRATQRIETVSSDAGTEPIVRPLVKETKGALRVPKLNEKGEPIAPPEPKEG